MAGECRQKAKTWMTCQLLGCFLARSSKGGCRVLSDAHGGVLLQDVASNVSSPHAWSSFDSRRMAGECRQKAKTWMTCQLLGCFLARSSKGGCRVLSDAHGGVLLQDVASNVSSPHAWSSFDSRRMAGECRQKAKTWMTCQLLGCFLARSSKGGCRVLSDAHGGVLLQDVASNVSSPHAWSSFDSRRMAGECRQKAKTWMTCQLLGCFLARSSKGGCRVLSDAHGGVLLQDVASNVSSPHAWSSFDSRRMAGECRQKAKTWMTCQLLGCFLARSSKGGCRVLSDAHGGVLLQDVASNVSPHAWSSFDSRRMAGECRQKAKTWMTCQLLGCFLARSSKGGCRVLSDAHGGVLLQDVASNVSSPHAWSSFDSRRMAGECRQKAKTWMTCQLLGCFLARSSKGGCRVLFAAHGGVLLQDVASNVSSPHAWSSFDSRRMAGECRQKAKTWMTCQLLGCFLARSSKGGCRVLSDAHGGVLLQDVASNVSSPHAWSSFDSRRMAGECRQKAKTWMTCQLLGCFLASPFLGPTCPWFGSSVQCTCAAIRAGPDKVRGPWSRSPQAGQPPAVDKGYNRFLGEERGEPSCAQRCSSREPPPSLPRESAS
ncbi:uncharacterized protein LOC132359275 isoform X8 [Balaenoptera ricei]|uniref:uncharacterized protein LOC132359275 isoform X8 n=1 Tax=Balaenoptera ricei TaxID=2746895 RepID=UPI0028BF3026|nr:uncharacterized protein LOC132359275 isoform X8 [Balaenoptera ricei]